MALEIERRWLCQNPWKDLSPPPGDTIHQGYLCDDPCIRVRLAETSDGKRAWLTLKTGAGVLRYEYEYKIPPDEGAEIIQRAKWALHKIRYKVTVAGRVWEVDRFLENLDGYWIAEVELDSPDDEVVIPSWCGLEITDDLRYTNLGLAKDGWPQ